MDTEERFVPVPGGEVFVRTWSPPQPGAALPLILMHDSLGSVDLWRDFPAEMATRLGRQVVAYDRLGFGRSSAREGVPSMRFIDEEAEIYFPAVAEGLGIDRFAMFGHSVGGGMSVAIGAASGERCQAVITAAAQAFVEERTREGIRQAMAAFSEPGQFQRLVRWHGDKAQWVLDAWTEIWLSPEFASWSLDADLAKLTCPVLAIHGDDDEYGSVEFPRRIANLAAGPSEMVVLDGCGHMPHVERRDEVLELISRFSMTM